MRLCAWRWLLLALPACGRCEFDAEPIDAMPDPSLIAHYRFDDDPLDGVLDSTGNGHTGGCNTTCPVVETGKLGKAYRFNGTSDYIVVPDASDLRPPSLTASMWLFKTEASGVDCLVSKLYGAVSLNSWQLVSDASGDLNICTTGATSGRCDRTVANVVTANRWHHIAYVHTGTDHVGYIDGIEMVRATIDITYDTGRLLFGADIDNATEYCVLAGLMDDVRIYNRALAQTELTELAKQ
ncbi:MAG TPA: LamG domain-containing protein [Kofleriaceae bacterium]